MKENENFEKPKKQKLVSSRYLIDEENNEYSDSIGHDSKPCIEKMIKESIPTKTKDFGKSSIFEGKHFGVSMQLSTRYGDNGILNMRKNSKNIDSEFVVPE